MAFAGQLMPSNPRLLRLGPSAVASVGVGMGGARGDGMDLFVPNALQGKDTEEGIRGCA